MKNLIIVLLSVMSSMTAYAVNADTNSMAYPPKLAPTTTSVWPNSMPAYRWPTQQMINQSSTPQYAPTYSTPLRYPSPYSVMQYPNTAYQPPVLRYPANQTFQQARPVYNFNMPYGTPMMANPYAPRPQYGYSPASSVPPVSSAPQVYRAPQATLTQPNPNMAVPSPYKPMFPAKKKPEKKKKKPWGDTRHIWPDFYTDATGDLWDDMMNAPYDIGRMPGGWRAPSLSTPDPVTVGDAVANQVPPVIDEVPNFMPLMN